MAQATPETKQPVRPNAESYESDRGSRRTVIDDTLATEAIFDLDPAEIRPDATDPEGLNIGEKAAAEILRELRREGLIDGDAIDVRERE
jgi:hypothetical protein